MQPAASDALGCQLGLTTWIDGTDTWVIDKDDAPGPIAPYTSESAYLPGGVLVAHFAFLTITTRTTTARAVGYRSRW